MNENFVQTLQACKGQYIALLDGDDCWTSPHKLQKQVDFLESHPDYSICFHNVMVVYEDSSVEPHPFHMREPKHHHSRSIPKTTSTLEDLVSGNFIQTCSVVFRAGLFDIIPEWFCDLPHTTGRFIFSTQHMGSSVISMTCSALIGYIVKGSGQ